MGVPPSFGERVTVVAPLLVLVLGPLLGVAAVATPGAANEVSG